MSRNIAVMNKSKSKNINFTICNYIFYFERVFAQDFVFQLLKVIALNRNPKTPRKRFKTIS